MNARGNILGIRVNAMDLPRTVETIDSWLTRREHHYVCLTAAHSVMASRNDPTLISIFSQSGLTVPDGMAIVWLLKLQNHPETKRVYAPDLMLEVCRYSLAKKWRHFFYGGNPGVAERLARRLIERFPGLKVAGFYSPPFHPLNPEEDRAIIQRINDSQADIVWVGTGSPRQERWMADHVGKLNAPVLLGVGAGFDFLSGNKPQAPHWLQGLGMEWLFRLLTEPRRLGKRYAQYPLFIALVVAQALGIRKYE
jgi:N-acetylglucosaminyldiphosphoundecaprenol N-acetyl-beta-D-mannosaminyltransferase